MRVIVESVIKNKSKMNESRTNGEAHHAMFQRCSIPHAIVLWHVIPIQACSTLFTGYIFKIP